MALDYFGMGDMSKDEKSTHYDAGGIEVDDVIRAKLTPEQLEGWYLGNAIKYSLRANFKGSKQRDYEKMAIYSRWLANLGVQKEKLKMQKAKPTREEIIKQREEMPRPLIVERKLPNLTEDEKLQIISERAMGLGDD